MVGVAAYDKAVRLANPARDATAVDTALRELAFDTILVTDGSLKELEAALEGFYAKLSNADVALVYFAGHGVQVNGRNFLVPRDLDPAGGKLSDQLLPVETILREIESRAPQAQQGATDLR